MEVLHGDIRITLNDQDAIRGVERIRATVKREMKAIGREHAVVNLDADLKRLRAKLKEADTLVEKHQQKIELLTAKRDELSGAQKSAATRALNAEQRRLDVLNAELKGLVEEEKRQSARLDSYKRLNREAQFQTREIKAQEKAQADLGKTIDQNNKKLQSEGQLQARATREDRERSRRAQEDIQKEGALRSRAAREMGADLSKREQQLRREHNLQSQALMDDVSRTKQVAELQKQYDQANARFQRLAQRRGTTGGRLREAVSPEIKERVQIDQARAIGEMEILRAKLEAMGAKPIDIKTHVENQKNVLAFLSGIPDIGTRIGPFAGTLGSMTKAALLLGPILVGLVGYVGGLAGAIGTGLAGALGIGSAAVAGFGLSLGGVGLLLPSLMRDFKNLNTLQTAYHKQVLKTGVNSDKAKTKLKEFNHALGEVNPTTRAAFDSLNKLQNRWRGMSHAARPVFLDTMAEGIKTINADWDIFSKNTLDSFKLLGAGVQDWLKGLRSQEGQRVINDLMQNTNRAIPPLLQGLGHLGAAFGRMAASFSRFLAPLFRDFDRWALSLDKASQNTTELDRGTGKLYRSFRQVWGVVTALSRVLGEFALSAMGPGGHMLDDLARGLNSIADNIHDDRGGQNKLGKFLNESADTTDRLYHAVLPLLKLFMEFSTIMRPWTDALLSVAGAVGEVTSEFARWGAVHGLLQGMAALWLFKRGTATIVSTLAGAANGLAAALRAVGAAKGAAALEGLGAQIAGGGAGAAASKGAAAGGVKAGTGAATAEAGAAGAVAGRTFAQKMGFWVAAGIAAWELSKWLENKVHSSFSSAVNNIASGGQFDLGEALGNLFGANQHIDDMSNKLTSSVHKAVEETQRRILAANLGITIDLKFDNAKAKHAFDEVMVQVDRTRTAIATSLAGAASDAEINMRLIRHSLNVHSEKGKQAIAANFRAVASEIRNGIKSGAIDTEKGMAAIHSYLVKALAALGVKGANAEGYLAQQDFRRKNPGSSGFGRGGAATGYIGSPGERGRDSIPLMVGAGEAVINRHQQRWVDLGLSAIGMPGGLSELFDRERTPHYAGAAVGHLPSYRTHQSGMLGAVTQGNVNKYHNAAQSKLNAAEAARSLLGPVGSTNGLAPLVKRAIAWARGHGWHGSVTSGFRTYSEQAALYARYLAGGNIAAKPGTSNHERGLAIDVSDAPGFNRAMHGAPRNSRLIWYGPGDPMHFSVDGHARGGFAKAARGKKPKNNTGTFSATSYGPPWGGIQGGGVTATGVNLKNGPHKYGVAVDPSVIPLGSEVSIWPNPFGYKGKFKAFDTGGAIKGRRIDFYDWRGRAAQNGWGRRSVEVSFGRLSTSAPQPQSIRGTQPVPRRLGPTSDFPNLIAEQQAGIDVTTRTNESGATALNQAALRRTLGMQNVASTNRLGVVNKLLGGRLTKDHRTELLSERAGLVSGISQNQQARFDLFKQARDNAFEFLQGKGHRRVDIDYRKALADGTETLDDDLSVAKEDQAYWEARVKYLRKAHANRADVTEALSNLSAAKNTVKGVQDNIKANEEQVAQTWLGAASAKAGLTPNMEDDLAAAQWAQEYYQSQYDLATTAGDIEGIGRWGDALKGARDNVKSISDQIAQTPLQLAAVGASLTNNLDDDVAASQALVDYWNGIYAVASGADRIAAGQNLGGAMGDLKTATRNAQLLPLERDQALAALTTTLDDDNAALVKLRDYWSGQLDAANATADIPGQIEAAQNLKGLNDQINEAQQNVAAQMVLLSEARRDLYRSFASNFISTLPAGFNTGGSSSYDQSKSVTVINNFQEQPADPHTWSASVNWELQAAV